MSDVMIKGGDIVMVGGTPYIVSKAEIDEVNHVALVSLRDGNYWSSPVCGSCVMGIELELFPSAVKRGAEVIGKITSFNGRAAIRS